MPTGQLYIGLMSGTSADAIDAALVDLSGQPRLLETFSRPYSDSLRQQVHSISSAVPDEIDRMGEIPGHVIRGLAGLGAFGIKIPREYGGLGLSQTNYSRAAMLLGGYCGNLTALLSAHQSIGVPQPLLVFGGLFVTDFDSNLTGFVLGLKVGQHLITLFGINLKDDVAGKIGHALK